MRWEIPSSSGRGRISFFARTLAQNLEVVLASVTIEGAFWQRDLDLPQAAQTKDFDVVLHQVLIRIEDLANLHRQMHGWLTRHAEFQCELGTSAPSDPRVILRVGRDEGLIYTPAKPACTLIFRNRPAMEGQWSFIVDESCLRICAEGLDASFRTLAAAAS